MPDDLNFQNISTVQNAGQPKPVTMAAATTIAPTTFVTFVTGTTAITTITPPVTGAHLLCLIFAATNASITTTGNVVNAAGGIVPTADSPTLLVYDPASESYYGGTLNLT